MCKFQEALSVALSVAHLRKVLQQLQQAQHITTLNKATAQHFLGLDVMPALLTLRNIVKLPPEQSVMSALCNCSKKPTSIVM